MNNEIPGYVYDPETNRYFKLNKHTPPEVKQKVIIIPNNEKISIKIKLIIK